MGEKKKLFSIRACLRDPQCMASDMLGLYSQQTNVVGFPHFAMGQLTELQGGHWQVQLISTGASISLYTEYMLRRCHLLRSYPSCWNLAAIGDAAILPNPTNSKRAKCNQHGPGTNPLSRTTHRTGGNRVHGFAQEPSNQCECASLPTLYLAATRTPGDARLTL